MNIGNSNLMLTLAIPNRNGAHFLEQTLSSLEKNRPHVRWWLQDSSSTDGSVEIAKRFAGALDHIQVESDRCQADGLNRAITQMGGDVIGFLNSDDCLADGAAEAVLAAFAADPELEMVYGEVEWIDRDGKSQGFHKGQISSLVEVLDIYGVWWNQKQWVQPEVFWRRSLWDRVGALNEAYDLAFDYEYWVRCFENGVKVKRIPMVLAQFRRHDAQKSTNSSKAASEIRAIVSNALISSERLTFRNKWRLENRLSYDLYQSTPSSRNQRPFWQVLARHPGWWGLSDVRDRFFKSKIFGAPAESSSR